MTENLILQIRYGNFMIGDRKYNSESKTPSRSQARSFKAKTRWFNFQGQKEREKEWETFESEALPLMTDIFRVARYLSNDRETAEDLTSETFVQALKSFHYYTPETDCRAWLVKILYRVNEKKRLNLEQSDHAEKPNRQLVFTPPIPNKSEDEKILQIIRKMPPALREIVLLADVEEFSCKEIAAFLQIPIATVILRLYRRQKFF